MGPTSTLLQSSPDSASARPTIVLAARGLPATIPSCPAHFPHVHSDAAGEGPQGRAAAHAPRVAFRAPRRVIQEWLPRVLDSCLNPGRAWLLSPRWLEPRGALHGEEPPTHLEVSRVLLELLDAKAPRLPRPGPWIYGGSRAWESGCIVSTYKAPREGVNERATQPRDNPLTHRAPLSPGASGPVERAPLHRRQ